MAITLTLFHSFNIFFEVCGFK